MIIRQFRYTDLDDLIRIAKNSFAEEYVARGETSESFVRQVRLATRGRMIPFKVVTALAGIKWGLFVAEVEGNVVGFGSYLGRKQMELANLMVHPNYRRRGIGQVLLEKRLQHLAEKGYPFVTTTILASNQASLGNVAKQGFEVFDRYTIMETPLPLHQKTGDTNEHLKSRPVQPADEATFKELEKQIAHPTWLQIQGSAASHYFLPFGGRLMNRFTNSQHWARVFTRNGSAIGFLLAITSSGQTKGILARPMIAEENTDNLPPMLHEAATWLTQLGKTAVQIGVPDERNALMEELQSNSWVKTQSWVRLVKQLKR
jgi:ribosomal protein S18 acetylase RimI-like enzyme